MSQRIEHKAKRIGTIAGKNKISVHTSRLSKLDQFLTTRLPPYASGRSEENVGLLDMTIKIMSQTRDIMGNVALRPTFPTFLKDLTFINHKVF